MLKTLKGRNLKIGEHVTIDVASAACHSAEGVSISTAMVFTQVRKETEKAVCLRGYTSDMELSTYFIWIPKVALCLVHEPGEKIHKCAVSQYMVKFANWFQGNSYQKWFIRKHTELSNTTLTDRGIERSRSLPNCTAGRMN